MLSRRSLLGTAAAVTAGLWLSAAQAATEINLWHAMGAELGEKLGQIAEGFNKSQDQYKVNSIYKGNYSETMTGAIAAFRARQHPHIVQVFEVGTGTMMAAKGAIYPVYKLMQESGEPFDPKVYLPTVTGYYTDTQGNMLSMPFNSSTPVLYYNKDAFKKAGLDPEKPPETWPEVGEYAKKLQASGTACGITTGWPSWVLIENFSALHDLPIATKANGFGGLDTELKINSPAHAKHIQRLVDWQKSKVYDYGGRRTDASPKFLNQECGMYIVSSANLAGLKKTAKFEVGVAMMPYWPDIRPSRQNSIIGGATLWVLAGHKPDDYKGIAKFFNYLSKPEVQADWHQSTGYLPITLAAYELGKQQGFYEKNPGTDVSIKQLTLNPPTDNSKGLRFGNFVQIRDIIEDEMESAFAGKKPVQQALDDAVRRGNELLRQFEKANS